MWYKNICSASFSFVTMHTYDRQTDGQTDRITTPKTTLAYARAVKTIMSQWSEGSIWIFWKTRILSFKESGCLETFNPFATDRGEYVLEAKRGFHIHSGVEEGWEGGCNQKLKEACQCMQLEEYSTREALREVLISRQENPCSRRVCTYVYFLWRMLAIIRTKKAKSQPY